MRETARNPSDYFRVLVDAHLQRWTVYARQAMLNNGEDAMIDLFAEIIVDIESPVMGDRRRMKDVLCALGFVQAYKSAFCPEEV